jgi:hypothetical protein
MRIDMNFASDQPKIRHLTLALAAISALILIHPAASRADDVGGVYAGRSLPSGLPGNAPKDQVQLALEPGSAALGGDTTRLEGERIFAGYRVAPGFAIEGAQIRNGASNLGASNDTIVVAGVGSVPLSDSVTLTSKFGVAAPAFAGSGASLSDVTAAGRVYGLGVSVQVRDNVEVRAQTEHLGRPASAGQGPTTSDSVLLGANVRF